MPHLHLGLAEVFCVRHVCLLRIWAGDVTDPVGTVASTSPYAAYSRPTLEAITTYFALELVG
jgi:hypothetical protein